MEKLKIAKVSWRDAAHYRGEDYISWFKENATTTDFVTVGHVIRSGRKDIVLAHEINDDNKARDTSIIPRSLITKIEYWEDK